MTDEEVLAAALSDPDAQPLDSETLKNFVHQLLSDSTMRAWRSNGRVMFRGTQTHIPRTKWMMPVGKDLQCVEDVVQVAPAGRAEAGKEC